MAEYAPLSIKSSVVGYGLAKKEQVQFMVARLLDLPELPQPADAADALAIAICHLHTAQTLLSRRAADENSWLAFVALLVAIPARSEIRCNGAGRLLQPRALPRAMDSGAPPDGSGHFHAEGGNKPNDEDAMIYPPRWTAM